MSIRQRAVLIGLGVAVLLLGAIAAVFALRGGSKSAATPVSATAPTTAVSGTSLVSLAPVPVGVTTTAPSARPTTTAAPPVTLLGTTTTTAAPAVPQSALQTTSTTAAPPAGTAVTADGALLHAPASADVRSLGAAGDCHALLDKGFTGTCGTVGPVAYLAERSLAGSGWRAYVFRIDAQKGTGTVVLQSLDDSGADYSLVKVMVADVLGDGSRFIGFGFHLAGTQTLAVDVVDGTGVVTMHRDLAQGAAWMSVGSFDDWAIGSGDAAGGYVHTVIHYVNGVWRVVQRGTATSVPASQL